MIGADFRQAILPLGEAAFFLPGYSLLLWRNFPENFLL